VSTLTLFERLDEGQQWAIADIIAAAFHDHYERLAPEHGYETREESRKAWGEVPEQNRKLMQATVHSLLSCGLIETPVR
jgi:hypothetical protein